MSHKPSGGNPRRASLQILQAVLHHGRNLPDALAAVVNSLKEQDRALTQALSYGVVRFYPQLDFIARRLLQKPFKEKDQDIYLLILIGLYQLREMRIPDHAAVSETVNVTRALKKPWARGLINAVLRNYQRQAEQIQRDIAQDEVAHFAHPAWWIEKIKQAWPQQWQDILTQNNQPPPFTLRINVQHTSAAAYLTQLQQAGIEASLNTQVATALTLTQPVGVDRLPGFAEGWVSVQDAAAQLAAPLLDPQAGERILDACAAPGGKTLHIFEQQPRLETLLALDSDATRLQRVEDNRQRGQARIETRCGAAQHPSEWWDQQAFDRILLDAPCSASGVIRRHPDIKLLRRAADLAPLLKTQEEILTALWPLLKEGGILLYATCSVFPEENARQVQRFLQQQKNARLITIEADWGHDTGFGRQVLPGEDKMDGFFYAKLHKLA
ncbi:MAG: 16S rRNA (cytosine(967)-C(5))-methyltransferase RsmB [Gammaproteobacteria bacterium]